MNMCNRHFYCVALQLFARLEEDPADRVPRPRISGQCVHGCYTLGLPSAFLLPRKLHHVPQDAQAKESRAVERVRETGEETQGNEKVGKVDEAS